MRPELKIFENPAALAEGVAAAVAQTLARSQAPTLVLSGGTTPRKVYERLASTPSRKGIRWSSVRIFWGDERCVGPEDEQSNFRMAQEALLRHVRPGAVHRIEGERPPQEAAERYEEVIRRELSLGPEEWPRFSLVLLGLGEDGHTASLFPGTSALAERDRIVTPVFVPQLGVHRVTLTVPALSHAAETLVVVSGCAKAPIVREVVGTSSDRYPIERIVPVSGRLLWYLDADAASLLEGTP